MKSVLSLAMLTLALSLTTLAQLNSLNDPQQPTAMSSGLETGKPQISGCLAQDASGKGFMLTNEQYNQGVPITSSKDLAAQVGHTVELTGVWKKSAASAQSGDAAEVKMVKTFDASKIRKLADKCVRVKKDPNGGVRTSLSP